MVKVRSYSELSLVKVSNYIYPKLAQSEGAVSLEIEVKHGLQQLYDPATGL